MLSLNEVAQLTYTTFQYYMDQRGINLAVGPLTDADANLLSRAYGDLNWDWYITSVSNRDDCFGLSLKLMTSREHKLIESSPAGVSLSTYSISSKTFDIHAVESFVRDSEDHPLRRRMVLYTLYAAVIFMSQAGGEVIRIIEPVEEKIAYYESFGFEMSESCAYVMTCTLAKLQDTLARMAD
ncbi:hypothetical protein [Erwinia persicina]|uniref:hypothetical protein n=1 Tax=Erwinia persicina TaxID=55211 RepID=UPI00078761C8|nr:hypothetical protein [Erwinia persicina]